jgi:hypothetical protein
MRKILKQYQSQPTVVDMAKEDLAAAETRRQTALEGEFGDTGKRLKRQRREEAAKNIGARTGLQKAKLEGTPAAQKAREQKQQATEAEAERRAAPAAGRADDQAEIARRLAASQKLQDLVQDQRSRAKYGPRLEALENAQTELKLLSSEKGKTPEEKADLEVRREALADKVFEQQEALAEAMSADPAIQQGLIDADVTRAEMAPAQATFDRDQFEHLQRMAPEQRSMAIRQLAHDLRVQPQIIDQQYEALQHSLQMDPMQQQMQLAQTQQDQRLQPRRMKLEEAALRDAELKNRMKWLGRGIHHGAAAGKAVGGGLDSIMRTFPAGTGMAMSARAIGAMDPLIDPESSYDYYDQLGDTLKMQSSIQEVLDNDPILSERSPEELMPIIQTLVQVAPEVVSQPPALAAILRQATSGQLETLDPLTLSQLAEAEVNLQKAKELRERKIRGDRVDVRL